MEETKQTVFVDDDLTFLNSMKFWQRDFDMRELSTSDYLEALKWLSEYEIKYFICDMKMPEIDGISVLEQAYKINPSIKLYLLTAYELNDDQKNRLLRIKANYFIKYSDLDDFLKEIIARKSSDESQFIIGMQIKLEKLEKMNREWAEDLLEQILEIPNAHEQMILTYGESFTVKDLVDDITSLSDRGLKHIQLWKDSQKRLRKIKRGRK